MNNPTITAIPCRIDTTRSVSAWPLRSKLARVLWGLFSPLFWSCWGRLGSGARVGALRLFGARIGTPSLVCGGVKVWMPWNLEMGDACTLGSGVEVYNFARIAIGDQTTISQYTFLCSASHDFTHPHMPLTMHPISIGRDAWICARAFVGPGVRIGDGVVVGACSVVTRDMPDWTVCAGNPCRPLKPRVLQEVAP
jgi:putative colanic acid biosynthesis acetyltransferase WcaF